MEKNVDNTLNLEQYYNEKITKYLRLAVDIKKLWWQETVVILPLIISTTGMVTKMLSKNLQQLGISTNIRNKMQEAVILSTTSIVRSFLNIPI